MKSLKTLSGVCAVVALALVSACGPSPMKVTEEFEAAVNAGNVDAAMALMADNVEVTDPQNNKMSGKDQVRAGLEAALKMNAKCELVGTRTVEGNMVTWTSNATNDEFTKMGVAPMAVKSEATLENGKITMLNMSFTPEAAAKMQMAMNEATKKVVMDHMAALNAGNMDAAMASVTPDIVLTFLPDKTFAGTDALKAHLTELFAKHTQFEMTGDVQVAGNKVSATLNQTNDDWKAMNIAPLEIKAEFTLDNGKIKAVNVVMSAESAAKLEQATAAAAAPAPAAAPMKKAGKKK